MKETEKFEEKQEFKEVFEEPEKEEVVVELEEIENVQETEENVYFEEYNEDYTRTKSLRKLITLVGFTAIMLVSSTYAWFSAQKNVTIGNLEGKVNVAEGMQISLDAKNWSQQVDFAKYTDQADLKQLYGDTEHNIIPTEMIPVSTTGKEGIDQTEITMYRGINTDEVKLGTVEATSTSITDVTNNKYPGYYAIDLFIWNSSRIRELDASNPDDEYTEEDLYDVLQLNSDSMVNVKVGGSELTGLQNTVRVALALYNSTESGDTASVGITATQEQILAATTGSTATIKDVAIWEPNASNHVDYIVTNNNRITWLAADKTGYIADQTNGKFTAEEKVPTYGLKSAATAITGNTEITDIYDWSGTNSTYLEKQITLQTTKLEDNYYVAEGVQNLISVNSTETAIYPNSPTGEVTTFKIPKNQICRLRMYVWLEGQDVDCTNFASHGGGIEVDLGLIKSAEEGSGVIPTTEPYLPTGFSYVEGTSLENGLTIEDGSGNQYVWVKVPKTTTVYATAGLNLNLDNLTETELTNAYTAIETDLKTYTSTYSSSYTDTYSSEDVTGLTETEYYELKNTMLKSVYENGGFYVGKYETGIADSEPDVIDTTVEARTASGDTTQTPVIQANAYPYNWVTAAQAQSLASGMESGEYTTSLMFGVQWDLVLKYLETSGAATVSELNSRSTSWGNYKDNLWNITNTSAKYYTTANGEWIDGAFGEKTTELAVILSTGANESFKKQNIYDLAGNVAEWTLELFRESETDMCVRGAWASNYGANASYKLSINASTTNMVIGFRTTLY